MEFWEQKENQSNSFNQAHGSKIKKTQKKPSIEALQVTIERKKQCSSKALDIVTRFSEETISETFLIENLQFINQEHYQDIVEERAINKLCGYPPCSGHLHNIPTKKYHISTSHNKVFDITDRKNFCSNMCYKASKFLKDQILTSPLWLRENLPPVTYSLISLHSKGGTVGDEVDLGFTPIKVDDNNSGSSKSATKSIENNSSKILKTNESISGKKTDEIMSNALNFCENSINITSSSRGKENENAANQSTLQVEESKQDVLIVNDVSLDETTNSRGDTKPLNDKLTLNSYEHQTQCENREKRTDEILENESLNITTESQKEVPNASKESFEKRKKKKKIVTKHQISSNNDCSHGSLMQVVVTKIEQTLREWFSIDSYCLIFGEEKLKEFLAEKKHSNTEFDNVATRIMDSHIYEKYMVICKKLNILEIEDSKMDMAFKEDLKKPLPDYEALKQEATELDLKVRMFYKGDKIVQFEESDKDASQSGFNSSNEQEPVLPLVDLHAQKALRRRIVMDKIKRILQDLQRSLCLRSFNFIEQIQTLVSTFDLSSHNITMRPLEWNIITIFIIKLLSVKDTTLAQAINSNPTNKNLTLLLMTYTLDNGYLERLIVWLSDIEYVLQKKS